MSRMISIGQVARHVIEVRHDGEIEVPFVEPGVGAETEEAHFGDRFWKVCERRGDRAHFSRSHLRFPAEENDMAEHPLILTDSKVSVNTVRLG